MNPRQPDPSQNPFTAILKGGAAPTAQPMPQMAPQGPAQGGGMAPQMMKAMQGGQMPQDQTQQGANPGTSKFLMQAMQALHGFIGESQDRQEIAIGRSIMQLLSRLIERDQQVQSQQL